MFPVLLLGRPNIGESHCRQIFVFEFQIKNIGINRDKNSYIFWCRLAGCLTDQFFLVVLDVVFPPGISDTVTLYISLPTVL
jgi:hypothetical protein